MFERVVVWSCRLIVGYVFHADGSMYAVSDCDLQLESVGEDGNDPVYCNFNLIAGWQYLPLFFMSF